ncbi:MAG: GDP-mannose 4,6-dehydratase [Chthoniobacterales bacterium]
MPPSDDSHAALIFGAGGQDGYYLAQLLRSEFVPTVGVSRSAGRDWLVGDVRNREHVQELIRFHQPGYIFHLAATSTTRHDALFENHETISTGTLNILEAVKSHSPETKVFLSGSGLQFENLGSPISEHTPFAATSPYAVARIQSVYAARYYRSLGLRVYVGYFFHHDSPRRGPNHVSQIIAQTARRIAAGSAELLELGDLSVRKEWGFAGDIVRGVWTLVQQDEIFEAAIGTGVAYSIADFVDACFRLIGEDWREHVKERNGFTADYSCLLSDPSTLRSLGWHPRVDLAGLATMMLDPMAEKA